ncbi:MAG TPA: hypothetical protein IAB65_04020 [Candidatus Onthocola stercorigallinarum]|nr:hypothetical protein [Candidatus Onthocola stercorigallinarum]
MKRNYIILGFVILLVLGGSIIWFVNKPEDTPNNNENDSANEQVLDPDAWKRYAEKIGIIEGENGWYYQWLITHMDGEEDTNNFLIGCNLKYSDFGEVPSYEDVDNPDSYPSITHSQKSINGVTESEESDMIDDYFDEMQFGRAIDINDLDDLDLYHFDKKFIVDLYNKAYNSEYDKTITKFNLKGCSINSDEDGEDYKDGYKYNIGVMHLRRGIGAIRIDLLYSDGTYLSDLVEDGKATNKQKEIYENFKKIEDYIVENQEVNIRDVFNLDDEVYIRLYNIIEKFDDPYE